MTVTGSLNVLHPEHVHDPNAVIFRDCPNEDGMVSLDHIPAQVPQLLGGGHVLRS